MKGTKKELAKHQREFTLSAKKVAGLEKELSKQQPQEDALRESIRRLERKTEKSKIEEAKGKNELARQDALLKELRSSLEEVGQTLADFEKQ
eukprot:COSAG02_NODE_33319_length_502_cov_0.699752_2_plen_91_part_01